MKVSYEYNWLIKELKEELKDDMLKSDSMVKIVRDRRGMVIDWFYSDDKTNEPTESILLGDLMDEIVEANKIF